MPLTRRRLVKYAGAAVAMGVAQSLGSPAIGAMPSLKSFRSTSKSWLWAPEDFALAKGFFRENGIDVEIIATERAPNIDALLSQAADIVLTPPDQAMRVQMKRQPVRLIAGLVNKYASHIVVNKAVLEQKRVALASPEADRVNALKGLRLATTGAGGAPDSLFRYLFATHGIDPDKEVQLTPVRGGGAAMLAALKQGSVDGFGLSSPTSDLAVRDFGAAYLFDMSTNPPAFFNDFLYIAVAATDRTIQSKGSELDAYYRGMSRALNVIRQDPDAYAAWSASFFSDLDSDLFKRAFANNSRIYMDDPRPTPAQFTSTVEFMNKQQVTGTDERIPATFTFKDWVDLRFADRNPR
jgi:NitT/TauT family transport system substrate-binding protein